MKKITWATEKRKISDLLPWDRNPRQLSPEQAENLEKSLEKFGVVEPPAINTDNTIIGGHQRSHVLSLMEEFGKDAEIDVRVPSRKLTEREVEELNVRLNKNTGSFDFDALANDFEIGDLMDWGFKPFELGLPADELDYDEIWGGMPDFQREPAMARDGGQIIVHFRNNEDRFAFGRLVDQAVSEKTKFIWFPIKEREIKADYLILDDESDES